MLKQYIGDGVYAEWNGNGVWLTTERYEPIHVIHRIYLEIETWMELKNFISKTWKV